MSFIGITFNQMLLSCIDYTCIIYVHIESVYSVCHGHFVKKNGNSISYITCNKNYT